ncbi:autolysin [Candidatus Rubidus massiliensis]|nr:MAG: hypothetical protein BGO10_02730 [Chlamydia sp. 32-24]CDZ79829.1 autolysin [Candidatus Rubidus massiliensis]
MKLLLTFLSLIFISFTPCHLEARRYAYEDENAIKIRETKDSIDELRHELQNQEIEMKRFEEKLSNHDLTLDSMRQQLLDKTNTAKEFASDKANFLETKINQLEQQNKNFLADLKSFKTFSQESAAVLNQTKSKINELEKIIDKQNENIENIQLALKNIIEVMQGKSSSSSSKSYKVKNGDSLEKIAKFHQTTIQALKEANHLTNDKIIVGQTIQIP